MTARPIASVFSILDSSKPIETTPLPTVMVSPFRPDLVRYVFTNMSKNKRQAYGVSTTAGHQHSAESWGTGRAVARIPRISSSGNHRSGQAAFGNMCRGGHMFNPNKTYRRIHRRINLTEKRHAVASALAATACTSLIMARGHRISSLPEVPLILSNDFEAINKTKQVVELLERFGLKEEMTRIEDSRAIRCGKGKMRNRKRVCARGPLIVYENDNGICKAARNIPGVETCNVNSLNLLKLAPGGTFGRLVLFTQGSLKRLQEIYVDLDHKGSKKNYVLPRAAMENSDLSRIINSNEIQSVLRPTNKQVNLLNKYKVRKNPLKNHAARARLNPAYKTGRSLAILKQTKGTKEYEEVQKQKLLTKSQGKSAKPSLIANYLKNIN